MAAYVPGLYGGFVGMYQVRIDTLDGHLVLLSVKLRPAMLAAHAVAISVVLRYLALTARANSSAFNTYVQMLNLVSPSV